jgi:uncharacterized membrane protein YhfC
MDIVARILNFSLMIGMPFALAVYLLRRFKAEWRLFGVGVITFVLSQVGHIPFNAYVLNPFVENLGLDIKRGSHLLMIGIVFGLSAGVFEEVTRYFGYRFWVKDDRDWGSALMYGAGHGGIESIILGIITLYAFIQAILLQGTELSTVVSPDKVELARSQLEAYWSAPWHLAILGAVERMATLVFHISATVIVLQSFIKRNLLWLALAIFWHTLLDAVAVYASQTWNPYITEAIIMVFGVISLGIILIFRSKMATIHDVISQGELPKEVDEIAIKSQTPSAESLEDSRYQ